MVSERSELRVYWGYEVQCQRGLGELLRAAEREGYLVVLTSRRGVPFRDAEGRIAREAEKRGKLLLVFGTWNKGLHEIAEEEGLRLEDFSEFVVNVAPLQGTRTIRTEEAVMIALSLLNNVLP